MRAQQPELLTLVMQITLMRRWGREDIPMQFEDFLWETVSRAPSLKNLIMTIAIQDDQEYADSEVTSHSSEGCH